MSERALSVGDRAVDTHTTSEDVAIVVEIPSQSAAECYIGALETTVADVSPNYPPDSAVITVAYVDDLDTWASGWKAVPDSELADRLVMADVQLYTYPAGRFERATTAEQH